MSTFNGIGTTHYGRAKRIAETYVTTRWLVFLYLPILPLESYRIWPIGDKFFTLLVFSRSSMTYQIVERIPLRNNLVQIIATWSWTLVPLLFLLAKKVLRLFG